MSMIKTMKKVTILNYVDGYYYYPDKETNKNKKVLIHNRTGKC